MPRPYKKQPVTRIPDNLERPIAIEMDRALKLHQETLDNIGSGSGIGPHASQHQNGGTDEINVAGLSGVLADPQTAIAHALLDGSRHSDTSADTVSRGSIIVGNSTPLWDELVIGAAGTVLGSDGTDAAWRTTLQLTVADFLDTVFRISDNGNNSRKLAFELGGLSAVTRTLTPQDASYTIAGTNLAQTFTAAQSITIGGGTGIALSLTGDDAGLSDIFQATAGSGSGGLLSFSIDPVGAFNCGTFTVWPSGVGVGSANNVFDPTAITGARTITMADVSGRMLVAAPTATALKFTKGVVVGTDAPAVASGDLGKVDLTGQGADIAAVNLSNGPPSGLYRVSVYVITTTAGIGAGTLAVTIGYNDGAARTATPTGGTNDPALHNLAATGFSSGSVILRRGSGEITYTTAATGGYGSGTVAVYSIYIRVECLS